MLPLCSTLQIYVTTVQYTANLCNHYALHYKFILSLCNTLQIYIITLQYTTNLCYHCAVPYKFMLPLCSTLQYIYCGCRGLLSHLITLSDTHTHSVGLLWSRDRPVAETSIWQLTTFTTDRQACPRAEFEPAIPATEQLAPDRSGRCGTASVRDGRTDRHRECRQWRWCSYRL